MTITSVEQNNKKVCLEKIKNEYFVMLKNKGVKTSLAKTTSLQTGLKLFDFIIIKEFKTGF